MARKKKAELRVPLPEGVAVTLEGDEVTVTSGDRTFSRRFEAGGVAIRVEGDAVVVAAARQRKRARAVAGTIRAHIANMIKGVTEGFEYRMRIVYSHFPMKVRVENSEILVDNFLGEKFPRRAKLIGPTVAEVKGDTVILRGPDVEALGQTAANVERTTTIKGFDPRVFQDGIYLVSKSAEEV